MTGPARARGPDTTVRRRSWRDAMFCVLDFEATAAAPAPAVPLAAGWVPVRDGTAHLAGAGYELIHQEGPLSAAAVPVHRILPEDTRRAADPAAVAAALSALLRDHVLVAHAVGNELALLAWLGIRLRRRDVIDTAALARSIARLDGHSGPVPSSLARLARHHELPVHRPHHAFGDALTTAGLFLYLATACERHRSPRLGDLLRLGGAGVLGRVR